MNTRIYKSLKAAKAYLSKFSKLSAAKIWYSRELDRYVVTAEYVSCLAVPIK